MLSRGKILVQLSLQGTSAVRSSDSRTFTIRGNEINESNKHTTLVSDQSLDNTLEPAEYIATKISTDIFQNECASVSSQHSPESMVQHENVENSKQCTNDGLSSRKVQEIGPEGNEDGDEYHSDDSDITLDYDDEVRDPDWKNPEENPSSESDENNNIPEQVDHEEIVEPEDTNRTNVSKRKRKNGKMKEIQKKKRMSGEKYAGVKKNEKGVKTYCTERAGRFLCPSNCGKKCEKSKTTKCKLLTEEDRAKIFEKFWKEMTWEAKKCYVTSHVDKRGVQQRTKGPGENSRRNFSYTYHLRKGGEAVEVCQSMFSSTLGMNLKTIYNWLNESDDRSGKQRPESERTRLNNERKMSATVFLTQLPKVESHYCRAKTKKQYLESLFQNKSDLYREYVRKTESEGGTPYNQAGFFEIFESMNLAIWKPKKDQCDKCVEFEAGNLESGVYESHIQSKNEARESKTVDKDNAERDARVKVITMDLQSLLICPRLEASCLYYKMKLSCHNFTMYDLSSKEAMNYFWHEGEGELNANVFASCVTDYLDNIDTSNTESIILYSDGCTYQNRNCTMANALLLWAAKNNIVVYQKYLERGHTQMECDSVHSVIERKIRKQPIYVPQMYVDNIEQANHKYKVKYIDHTFFNDYENLNYYTTIRPGTGAGSSTVTDIRVLRYNTDGKIEYKLKHSDAEFLEIPRARSNRTRELSVSHIPDKLYRNSIPIKKGKYQHLMQLKSVVPKDYHGFYDNLPHVT